ncbi:S8 family serine peptidase [Hymenobacter oligotrophus]|uniref:S8 family serine peptidase n=1 Tax=Hymenobacter oligotrophus TaxID=2319843 RepID=UPI0013C30AE2|nr:S8 family serine peptidase [Hymenobacter oligotrophus]
MLLLPLLSALLGAAPLVLPGASAPEPAATQTATPQPAKYWVFLRDKRGVSFRAEAYFSAPALARRRRQGLPLSDSTDFPLRPDYLRQVQQSVDSVAGSSRWFNAVACWAKPHQVAALRRLPGVRAVEPMPAAELRPAARRLPTVGLADELTADDRQLAHRQTSSLGAEALRKAGLNGRGIRVAILDVGFTGASRHPGLAHLQQERRVVATYDFIKKSEFVYGGGMHGTEVLSCLAGALPDGTPLGLAPQAEYLLARTERTGRETFGEEEAWLAAAEWADRNGADILNSSLGYTDTRYFREQMNGRTSLVARAAAMAVRKGMLVVCAAGNDGDDPRWRTVGTPADADSVLAVGGLDADTWLATEYSSRGPAAGGRRKPNVAAFGSVVAAVPGGRYERTEGTSFASPLVAGLAACVWQQQRGLKAMELFHVLEQSGRLYPYFDYAHGYGLPQAVKCLQPSAATARPTLDAVTTTEGVEVVIRPEATLVLRPLPLRTDSAVAAPRAATADGRLEVPRAGKERTATAQPAPAAPDGIPLPPPNPEYCYWQLADAAGRLRRYEVLEVSQRAVLQLPTGAWQPGDVLRVHYRGFTLHYPLP